MVFQGLWSASGWCRLALLLVLLLSGCNSGGSSGSLSTPAAPSRVEEKAVTNLLQEYRASFLQEDIDRLQSLLQTDGQSSASIVARQQGQGQESGASVNARAFLEAISEAFRTHTITNLDLPDAGIRVAADRRSVSFLEVESRVEMEAESGPTSLVQRTRAFRTSLDLAHNEKAGVVTLLITTVKRDGPLVEVTTRGRVAAGALARVEVTAGTWPLQSGEVEVPETKAVQTLQSRRDIWDGLFTPPAHPTPQSLRLRLHGKNGETIEVAHRYQVRAPGDGVVQKIADTGTTRFHAVALAPDGTAWFGGETRGFEAAAPIRVGNILYVAADGRPIFPDEQPTLERPQTAVTSARIEDIVIDQLGRVHFLFLAENDDDVVGNGDIIWDPKHRDRFCQTVNAFSATGTSKHPDYPFTVRDPRTGEMRSSPSVRALAAGGGDIWLFGSDGGVARAMDTFRDGACPSEGVQVRYGSPLRRGESGLLSNSVIALTTDAAGPRWFGTAIGLQDRQYSTVPFRPGVTLPSDVSTLEGFYQKIAQAIFQARPIALDVPEVGSFNKGDLISSIVEDAQGRLWVGTLGAGIRRIEAGCDGWRDTLHLRRADEQASTDQADSSSSVRTIAGLSGNVIFALAEGPDGAVWAATNKGVSRIQEQNGAVTMTNFSALDGLTPPARDVAVGKDGTVWLATDGGMFRIVPQGGQVRGVARDAAGRPVAGADVTVLDTPFRAVTDVEGHFVLANLPLGAQVFQVEGKLASGGPFISAFRRAETVVGDQVLEAVQLDSEEPRGLRLTRRQQDGQTELVEVVGTQVRLEVQLLNGDMPVQDTPVTFRTIQGVGTPTSSMVSTDSNGRAAAPLALGPSPDLVRVEAQVRGLEPVVFTLNSVAKEQIRLVPISGNNQTAAPGEELAEPLVVRVLDQFGNPKPGVRVSAIIEGEADFLSETTVVTKAPGDAQFRLRVRDTAKEPIVVNVEALNTNVTFLIQVGFVRPTDVAVEQNGSLVIVDERLKAVLRIDRATAALTLVSAPSKGKGQSLLSPTGIAVNNIDGSLIVADTGLKAVVKIHPQSGDRIIVSDNLNDRDPLFIDPQRIATVAADDSVVVTDAGRSAVVRVNLRNGDRTIISGCAKNFNFDTGRCAGEAGETFGSGPPLVTPMGIGVEADGKFLVVDDLFQAVIRVDPSSGERTVVSGCIRYNKPPLPCDVLLGTGRGTGPRLVAPKGIAVDPADGFLRVVGGFANLTTVVKVNPKNGDRDLVSGFNPDVPARDTDIDILINAKALRGNGPLLIAPSGVAIEANASMVIVDTDLAAVVRVEPTTGNRTVIAHPPRIGGGSLPLESPEGIAVTQDGRMLVAVDAKRMAVVEVHPETGDRTIRSGCLARDQLSCIKKQGNGPLFVAPTDLAIGLDGSLIVVDGFFDLSVVRIFPESNERTLVSGIDPDTRTPMGGGPSLIRPKGIAVRENGNLVVVGIATLGTATGAAAVVEVNLEDGERSLVSGVNSITRTPRGDGPRLRFPQRVIAAGNFLWIVDSGLRAVVRVDAGNGDRRVVSGVDPDKGEQGKGPAFVFPTSIAIMTDGSLVVGDQGLRAVMRVDPGNGDRRVVSGVDPDKGEQGKGPPLIFPRDIAVEGDNSLVVADSGLRALVRVTLNGERSIISRAILAASPDEE